MSFNLLACSKNEARTNSGNVIQNRNNPQGDIKDMKLKITVGDKVLTATLFDNATTRELISRLPLTLPMKDLYEREVVYNFPEALPVSEEKRGGYEVGDISYWSPWKSFVIFYKQNGEIINLQKIGHIDSGVEIFETTGNTQVKFELLKE
jgi:hypothetical protein